MSVLTSRATILHEEVLSDDWYSLKKYTVDYQRHDGTHQQFSREVYDKGDGATLLLYNRDKQTVILTRQFRLPLFIQGESGFLIETTAGLLEGEDPITRIRLEAEEETGYRISHVTKIFDLWMSPGAITEKVHYFIAEYSAEDKINLGGGLIAEGEDIEVLEFPFKQVVDSMMRGEIKDAKTLILLQYAVIHRLLDPQTS